MYYISCIVLDLKIYHQMLLMIKNSKHIFERKSKQFSIIAYFKNSSNSLFRHKSQEENSVQNSGRYESRDSKFLICSIIDEILRKIEFLPNF